jgi:tetratricopeptide (TPR) repeat protein
MVITKNLHRQLSIAVLLLGTVLFVPARAEEGATPAAPSPEVQALIEAGRNRLAQGDSEGALRSYDDALTKDPDNIVALYFAGNLSLQLNQVQRGLALLSRAAALAPNNAQLWLLLGQAYERFATAEDAMRAYKHLLDTSPTAPEAKEANKRYLLLSGKSAAAQGNAQQAQEILSKLLNDYPRDPAVLTEIKALNQAREQTRAGIASELTPEKLSAAAGLSASDVPTLLAEGKKRLAQNDAKGALQAYEAVILKDSNNIEALFYAGNLYLQANNPDQGLKYLARTATLAPKNVKLRMTLAQDYERFSRLDDAIREYQAIAAQNPAAPEGVEANKKSLLLSGRRVLAQGQPEDAEKFFAQLTQLYPNDPSLRTQIEAAKQAALQPAPAVEQPGGAPPSSEIAALLAEGKAHLDRHDTQGALEVYESILAKDPNNTQALFFAANLHLQLKHVQQGLGYLTRSVALAPKNTRLRMQLAQNLEKYQFFGDALREYQQIIDINPTAPEAKAAEIRLQILQSIRAISENKLDESLSILDNMLKQNPGNPDLLTEAVNVYLGAKRLDYTELLLEAVIKRTPGNIDARYYLADMYERDSKLDQAILQYDALLKALPQDDPQTKGIIIKQLKMKGALAFRSKAYDEARKYFEEASALDPADLMLEINVAGAYRAAGDAANAEATLNGILKKNPDFIDAYIRLGTLYIQQSRLDDAARAYEEIRIRAAGSPVVNQAAQTLSSIYSLAQGAEIRDRAQTGLIADTKKQLEDNPDSYELWSRLARMSTLFSRTQDAMDAYENVVRVKPDDMHALETLAGLYDDASQYEKAEAAFTKVRDNTTDTASRQAVEQKLTMVVGKKAFGEKKMGLAETSFKEAVESNPQNYIAFFYLGLIHTGDSRFDDAAHDFEQVVKIVPAHSAAHFQLALVYEQLQRDEDALTEYRTVMQMNTLKEMQTSAENRIAIVQNRIDGFDYSVSYTLNYSDNPNLTSLNPAGEQHSDLVGSVNYHHKLYRKPISIGVGVSPSYITYHVGQSDTLAYSITPYTNFLWRDINFSTNLTYSSSSNFATQEPVSEGYNFSSDMSSDFRMPALVPWLVPAEQRGSAPSTWRFSLAANQFTSTSAPTNDANLYTLGASLTQSLGNSWRISGNYSHTINVNANDLGNDLAYKSNALSGQISTAIGPRLSLFGGYTYTRFAYTNPDSFSLFTKKRKSGNHGVSVGANYFLDQNLRLFGNLAFTLNRTSLPTGYILDPTNFNAIVGVQSNALGNYRSWTAATGIAFSF